MSATALPTIAVCGAGIGGLALTLGLLEAAGSLRPFRVILYEREQRDSRTQGYQIGLNPNGARVVKSVLPAELLETAGLFREHAKKKYFKIVDPQLRGIVSFPFESAGGLVDRWRLRELLLTRLNELSPSVLQWNKQVVNYTETDGGVELFFQDGSSELVDYVVAADGARSAIRAQRCPNLTVEVLPYASVFGKLTGAIAEEASQKAFPTLRDIASDGMVRIVGSRGSSILILAYNQNGTSVVWWSLSSRELYDLDADGGTMEEDETDLKHRRQQSGGPIFASPSTANSGDALQKESVVKKIRGLLQEFHSEVLAMVESSPVVQQLRPLSSISTEATFKTRDELLGPSATRVTLLGDAAHLMTTQAGLGANTALMDAEDLIAAFRVIFACPSPDVSLDPLPSLWQEHIRKYEEKMLRRGFANVAASRRNSEGLHATGWGAWTRDTFMRSIGSAFALGSWLGSWFQ